MGQEGIVRVIRRHPGRIAGGIICFLVIGSIITGLLQLKGILTFTVVFAALSIGGVGIFIDMLYVQKMKKHRFWQLIILWAIVVPGVVILLASIYVYSVFGELGAFAYATFYAVIVTFVAAIGGAVIRDSNKTRNSKHDNPLAP